MLRTIISFTPFMVCLFWLIVYLPGYRKYDSAKKVFTWFLQICTVLYFCHALFFTVGQRHILECIWALCSLSVYSISYLYICALTTSNPDGVRRYWVLLPGIIVFILMLVYPGTSFDMVRVILFTIQVVFVCCSGMKMLSSFERLVTSSYADTEGRTVTVVKNLLFAFVLTSLLSVSANIVGRSVFASDIRLLAPIALLFSSILFAISYIEYNRDFSYKDFSGGTAEDYLETMESTEVFGRRLDQLMAEKKLYLKKNLKINDVAALMGSYTMYLSHYINEFKGEPFSDYINRLRVDYAKTILIDEDESKRTDAEQLGFSSERSFYRNFKKFTGMTPAQWKKRNKNVRSSHIENF